MSAAFSDIQVILLAILALAQLIVFGLLQWRALGLAARPTAPQPSPPGSVPVPAVSAPHQTITPSLTPPPAPAPTPVVDQGLVNFIKQEEGFSPKAVWDYKQYSIGYGTKANAATDTITEAAAEAALTVEINKAEQLVESFAPNAPKGVKQALTDLTYNAGAGWETGSLGAAVKAQKWDTVKADILLYNHAGGQVLAGLTARRLAETSWFDNPL